MSNNSDEIVEKVREANEKISRSALMEMIGAVNDLVKHLSSTLISIATFLFIFSSPFINFFVKEQPPIELFKILLLISWVFIFASVIFGLIQILIDLIYFDEEIVSLSKRTELFSIIPIRDSDLKKNIEEVERNRNNFKRHSSHVMLLLQSIFVSTGFILILITAALMLFKY